MAAINSDSVLRPLQSTMVQSSSTGKVWKNLYIQNKAGQEYTMRIPTVHGKEGAMKTAMASSDILFLKEAD